MANANIERMNQLIRTAPDLYNYFSRQYLNRFKDQEITFDVTSSNVYDEMIFYRMTGYREFDNKTLTQEALFDGFYKLISSSYGENSQIGAFIINNNGKTGVYYAKSAGNSSYGLRSRLESAISDVNLENGFVDNEFLNRYASVGGVITGIPELKGGEIDLVIDAMKRDNFLLAVLAEPILNMDVQGKVSKLKSLRSQYESVSSTKRTLGQGTQRIVETKFSTVENLLDCLDKLIKYYEGTLNNGLFRVCIWYAASNLATADKLAEHLLGVLSDGKAQPLELLRRFRMSNTPFKGKKPCIAAPDCFLHLPSSEYNDDICDSLTTLMSSEHLARLFMPPLRSHYGFHVVSTLVESDAFYGFDINPPFMNEGRHLRLGTVIPGSIEYCIPLERVPEHIFVAGAPGSGKTNTVMNLLVNVEQKGIPFIVIEPVKKEYWRLIHLVKDLHVYSAGDDAIPLLINPLEPEDGTPVGNHIDALLNAFRGAFDMESPLPEVLSGLLVKTYRDFGWETDMRADSRKRKYPVLADLYANIEEYIEKEVPHGREVKDNIKGAITVRIGSLLMGPVGKVVNIRQGISAKQLLSRPTLVELDDLSFETKVFVTNVLTLKINEYLRSQSSNGELKHVLVIEEAHNIFTQTSGDLRGKSSKGVASEYFSNMFLEIRALGTGIIIADQRPSQINSNANASTAIKIIHSMNDNEDIEKVRSSLGLSDYQSKLLRSLGRGEAVVAVRGEKNVCKVKIDSVMKNINAKDSFLPCIMCSDRMRCTGKAIDELIAGIDRVRLTYEIGIVKREFQNNRYKEVVDRMVKSYCGDIQAYEKVCFFGKALEVVDLHINALEKRRMLYEYKMLTGG